MNYYNEHDPFAAAWLRALIAAGEIANGVVDERDIQQVRPDELRDYRQVHLFAGIGGWSLALRLAGIPDDFPVWTGSCPCQPFSSAGARKGTADPRHLWPEMRRLIRACKPAVIFGEQVASAEVLGVAGKRSKVRKGVPQAESSKGLDSPCEIPRPQEGIVVRPVQLRRINSGENRSGPMRANGTAVQSGGWSNMGQPVAGPNKSGDGIYLRQRAGCLPRCEQCDRRLGRGEAVGDRQSDYEPTPGCLECLIEANRRTIEAKNRPEWFARICADLEDSHYVVGACDLPAAGVGAPHIRQRLFWVAESENADGQGEVESSETGQRRPVSQVGGSNPTGRLGDVPGGGRAMHGSAPGITGHAPFAGSINGLGEPGRDGLGICGRTDANEPDESGNGALLESRRPELAPSDRCGGEWPADGRPAETGGPSLADGLGNCLCGRCVQHVQRDGQATSNPTDGSSCRSDAHGSSPNFWSNFAIIYCRDGKYRRVPQADAESEILGLDHGIPAAVGRPCPDRYPLATKTPGRVGRLKGYGNAIVPELAAEFIRAFMEARHE